MDTFHSTEKFINSELQTIIVNTYKKTFKGQQDLPCYNRLKTPVTFLSKIFEEVIHVGW